MRLKKDCFVVATRFKHIGPGDIVEHADNPLQGYEIERVGGPVAACNADKPIVTLYVKDRSYTLQGNPDEPINLVHRPRPEGKTEDDMLGAIFRELCETYGDINPDGHTRDELKRAITSLHPLMEAHELGKPLKVVEPTAVATDDGGHHIVSDEDLISGAD